MTMNRKLHRTFSFVFTAACAIGMIYQQFTIVNLFLDHKVTTTTSVYTPRVLEYMALTACFSPTVINLTLLNEETSSNWTAVQFKNYPLITTISGETLLKYAPNAKHIIHYYNYIDPTRKSDRMSTMNYSSEKFLYDYNICYKIRLNSYHSVPIEDAAGLGALGRIVFTSKVNNTRDFKIAFGSPDKIPLRDITASRYIERDSYASKQHLPNLFESNHFEIVTQSLPYPYESNCYDYKTQGMNDNFECLNSCFVNKSLEQFNALPRFSIILKNLNYTFLSRSFRTNSTLFGRLSRL